MCLPINLPTPGRSSVINVFEHDGNDAAGDQTDFSSMHAAHRAIVEQVIEVDDDLTEQYLEKGEGFDPQKLHAAFEKALEQAHLVPVLFCSARTGAGIDDMVHVFASLCPSPEEVSIVEFLRKDNERSEEKDYRTEPNPGSRLVAHIIKVTTDPFVGKLGIFRVHQGTLKAKTEVIIDDHKKPLKVGHLFKLQGKDHVEVHEVGPGEIAAVAKLEEIHFNGVLHDSHDLDYVRLKPLALPRPMYGLAIELKNHADETKFASAAHKLMAEDPCFVMERISATKQTVIRGLGELHLRIVLEKLKTQYNIELITSTPKVAYKETISVRAEGHCRHKKQTGGAGQFGEVYLRIEPLEGHPDGFEFVSEVVGGTVPRQYWPAVEKGVRTIIADGCVAGYPMTGIRCVLYDGKYHDVDSKEIAFFTAGKKAFIDAVQKARARLLEPFVHVEVNLPASKMGDLAGHLSTKRGRVQDTQLVGADVCVVKAIAPLAELQNFATELKSLTGGAGTYTMDHSHDEFAPANVQSAVIAAYKPHHEEE
jgi:elongation factor G